jgi:hypothetical protein
MKKPHTEYDRIKQERWFACTVFGFCLTYFIIYVAALVGASYLFDCILTYLGRV